MQSVWKEQKQVMTDVGFISEYFRKEHKFSAAIAERSKVKVKLKQP